MFAAALELPAREGDSGAAPRSSMWRLFEDGVELPHPHSAHHDIATNGRGRYSHWNVVLYFSSSDGSDPSANGREYVLVDASLRGPMAAVSKWASRAARSLRTGWHRLTDRAHVTAFETAHARLAAERPGPADGIDPSATWHRGASTLSDTLAIWWHLRRSDPTKVLALPSKLKIARYVDFDRRPKILEIGPSVGVVTSASLCRLDQDLTLFDRWAYHTEWRLLQDFTPNVKFVLGDAGRPLPFRGGAFDHCVFMGAICYIATPDTTLADIHRILRPGGLLFISSTRRAENNYNFDIGRFDPSEPTYWNGDELNAALERAGFDVLESYDFVIYPRWFYRTYRVINKFFFNWPVYNWLIARHPDKELFACSIARKRCPTA